MKIKSIRLQSMTISASTRKHGVSVVESRATNSMNAQSVFWATHLPSTVLSVAAPVILQQIVLIKVSYHPLSILYRKEKACSGGDHS